MFSLCPAQHLNGNELPLCSGWKLLSKNWSTCEELVKQGGQRRGDHFSPAARCQRAKSATWPSVSTAENKDPQALLVTIY